MMSLFSRLPIMGHHHHHQQRRATATGIALLFALITTLICCQFISDVQSATYPHPSKLPPFKNLQGPPEDFHLHSLPRSSRPEFLQDRVSEELLRRVSWMQKRADGAWLNDEDNQQDPYAPHNYHEIPAQASRGSWHLLVKDLHHTLKLPRNSHFYVSILMRYEGYHKHGDSLMRDASQNDEDLVLIKLTGPQLNVTELDREFQQRELYSFKYWEKNYELKNGDAEAILDMNHMAIVVIQDYDPPVDEEYLMHQEETTTDASTGESHNQSRAENSSPPQPLIEVESNVLDHRDFFTHRPIRLNVGLSPRSRVSLTQWASKYRGLHAVSPHGDMSELIRFSSVSMSVQDSLSGEPLQEVRMLDDGDHFDAQPHDGIYGGSLELSEPGTHELHVRLEGEMLDANNRIRTFSRSLIHVIHVLDSSEYMDLQLLASVIQDKDNKDMMDFYIPVKTESAYAALHKKYRAYAEVWGISEDSTNSTIDTPIAFVGGMTIADLCPSVVQTNNAQYACLKLKLSKQWLSRAKVQTTHFDLRNMFVQDATTSLVLGEEPEIRAYPLGELILGPESQFHTITERMLKGPRPKKLTSKRKQPRSENSTLMTDNEQAEEDDSKSVLVLSHGYCADDTPFTLEEYTDFITFRDPHKSRHNDDFALRIFRFVDEHPEGPFDQFSLVAHSQGGLATTHLYTFYWTAADNNKESTNSSRIIQSVGSPYRGTAVAGYLASIGKLVGIACGSNFDLTHEGAGLWAALIPKWVRKDLYFTTTTWEGNFSYCSLPLNTVLSFKNDGTCENRYAALEYANPLKQDLNGWCHTKTMNFPSQCENSKMNYEYNALAAR